MNTIYRSSKTTTTTIRNESRSRPFAYHRRELSGPNRVPRRPGAWRPADGSAVGVEPLGRDDEQLVLSTIHSAKGLEWQCVFLLWVVDGKFPSVFSFNTDEELEEERRLLYVAVTRAKRYLFLIYPINVYDKSSGMLLSKPSRFLDHVSPRLFETLALVEEGSFVRMGR